MSGKTVTRADLANAIYQLGLLNRRAEPPEPISREKSAEFVEAVLQTMSDSLVSGETVKISSFGAFEVREKAARIGRNPKTGEEAEITPRRVLVFRASHILKGRLNEDGSEDGAEDGLDDAEDDHGGAGARGRSGASGQADTAA